MVMTVLDQMSDAQRSLISSLPYRVGLWVSKSDSSGGDDADDSELAVLESLIHGFSGEVFGSELLQYIMADTLAQKDKWPGWADTLEDVPQDCEMAVGMLRDFVDEKEVKAYARRLMEIAEAVALAFREQSTDLSIIEKAQLYMSYFFYVVQTKKHQPRVRSFDEFLYISPHERKAINEIAARIGRACV